MALSIRIKMHGKEKYVALSEKIINKSSIKAAFLLSDDAVVKLSYESNSKQINCSMNEAGTAYLLPDGSSTMEFFAESNRAPSRRATPEDQAFVERTVNPYYPSLPPNPAPTAEAFLKWMFFLKDHIGKATVICVHPRYFVSFRHGTHLQLKLGDTLKMYTADREMDEQLGIDVTVVKVDESLDFILLKSEYNVVERGPSIARAEESAPFTLAGCGNEHGGLSYLYGTIHSVRDHYFNGQSGLLGPFILGNSSSSRGDSGGGIWGSRGLIGMNCGSTTMPQQFHYLAISEAATFSVKNIISPALRFKEALIKELEKERIEKKVASPPQKKPCCTTEFEGLGTLYGYKGHQNSEYKLDCRVLQSIEHVASGSEDGFVYIYSLLDSHIVSRLEHPSKVIHSLTAHPKKERLITAAGQLIYLWVADDDSEVLGQTAN